MFEPGSRYESVETYAVTDSRGRRLSLVKTRLIPSTPGVIARRIRQEDRPDLLAQEFYRQPELFWRLADANECLDPAELVAQVGRFIQIPRRP